MERSPMPPRKKPLQNTSLPRGDSELKRTELKRSTPLRSTPSPKLNGTSLSKAARAPRRQPLRASRPTRTREEVEAKRIVVRRCQFERCEGCGAAAGLDPSHRIGQGVGGLWRAGNLIGLCRSCHAWLGDEPTLARDLYGWRLESHQDYLTEPAWLFAAGWVLLDDAGGVTPTTREAA